MDINFNPGGVRDSVDTRDKIFHTQVGMAFSPFDWTTGYDIENEMQLKMPVKNQGQSGSCGGQAWSYYGGVLEFMNTSKTFEERSAKFIYAQTFVPGGGSFGRDNCNIAIKQGWAREVILTSYENGQPPSEYFMEASGDITDTTRQDAKNAKALSYYNVIPDIDTIAQSIRLGDGCILGVSGENNGTWLSAYPQPPIGTTRWGHWLYAGKAKLINGKKYIGVLNSWGAEVGEQGWQWLGEEYFTTGNVWNGWVLIYNAFIFHHTFNTDLVFGQEGDEIKALQQALQIDGEFPADQKITGFYGVITQQAVKAFQKKWNVASLVELLVVDGKRVGAKTRSILNQLYSKVL